MHDFSGDFKMVVLQTPQMAEVLSQAIFVEADVTYPGNLSFPYLLNIVTYNEETMVFQTVARVLLNKLTTAAYRRAFEEVFQITTNLHPCFNGGREVFFWIVDFSSAQYEGLAANIGKKEARARIVGCKVHFQRNARKIAAKICGPDRNSLDLFTSIAYKIPDLTEESQVFAAFDILSGETLLDDEEAMRFLTETLGITDEKKLGADTSKWSAAKKWTEWWITQKHLKMFTNSFREMTDAEWDYCPKTTNAVESQNKLCKLNSTLFQTLMEKFYRMDKKCAYEVNVCYYYHQYFSPKLINNVNIHSIICKFVIYFI